MEVAYCRVQTPGSVELPTLQPSKTEGLFTHSSTEQPAERLCGPSTKHPSPSRRGADVILDLHCDPAPLRQPTTHCCGTEPGP